MFVAYLRIRVKLFKIRAKKNALVAGATKYGDFERDTGMEIKIIQLREKMVMSDNLR